MGKLIQNILDSLKLTDEDDDFEDDETEAFGKKSQSVKDTNFISNQKRFEPVRQAQKPVTSKSYEEDYDSSRKERLARIERQQPISNNRIVPMRQANHGLEVCIMKPTRFEDSQDVCDMLKNERAIIVNLEGLDLALAQRIMDFISGAIYSLNAKIHQISGYIFCISPEKVDISGDYIEMISQNGFEVPNLLKN